jgi:hypothetical protein
MRLHLLPKRSLLTSTVAAALAIAASACVPVQPGNDAQPALTWMIRTPPGEVVFLHSSGIVEASPEHPTDSVAVLLNAEAPGGMDSVRLSGTRTWCGTTTTYPTRVDTPDKEPTLVAVELDDTLAELQSCPEQHDTIHLVAKAFGHVGPNSTTQTITIPLTARPFGPAHPWKREAPSPR